MPRTPGSRLHMLHAVRRGEPLSEGAVKWRGPKMRSARRRWSGGLLLVVGVVFIVATIPMVRQGELFVMTPVGVGLSMIGVALSIIGHRTRVRAARRPARPLGVRAPGAVAPSTIPPRGPDGRTDTSQMSTSMRGLSGVNAWQRAEPQVREEIEAALRGGV